VVLRARAYNDKLVPTTVELLYAVITIVFILSGLTMVGMAIRAYVQTSRTAMIHLSLGFSLAVAGAAATMISAFLNDFQGIRVLLLVKSSFFTSGFLFVMYSLVTYE
jgi:CHASE1-domain containing sensor protein